MQLKIPKFSTLQLPFDKVKSFSKIYIATENWMKALTKKTEPDSNTYKKVQSSIQAEVNILTGIIYIDSPKLQE